MKFTTKTITTTFILMSAGLFGIKAYAQQYHEDKEFTNWITEKCPDVPLSGPSDTANSSQDASVGNGPPSLKIDHSWTRRIAGCHLKPGTTIQLTENAAASLRFQFEGSNSGSGGKGVALAPLIKQNGKYFAPTFVGFTERDFTKWAATDLNADDFFPIYNAESGDRPDFSCGAAEIEVGVMSANQGAGTRSAHVDNWSVEAIAGESCIPKAADYLCYDLLAHEREIYARREQLTLKDQFGELDVMIGQPVSVCNPVDLNGEQIPDTEDHYVCYTVHDDRDQSRQVVEIENALEVNRLRTGRSGELCLRSTKKHLDQ